MSVCATLSTVVVAAFMVSANAFAHGGGLDKDGCHFDKRQGKRHCHGKPSDTKRWSVCDGSVPAPGDENVLYGRVVRVVDGDTFKARIQGAVMEFRMADIDAPELDQPYGKQAHAILTDAVGTKDVVMLRVDSDPYGRFVVHVWIANLQINSELVARGAAWFNHEYARDNCLFDVENEARDSAQGLWSLPQEARVEPWVWRAQKKDAAGTQRRKRPPTR